MTGCQCDPQGRLLHKEGQGLEVRSAPLLDREPELEQVFNRDLWRREEGGVELKWDKLYLLEWFHYNVQWA